MGLTARKPTEQPGPENLVTIKPVTRPTLALVRGVTADEFAEGEGPAKQNDLSEEDMTRRRREAFLAQHSPTMAAGWVGVGNKFFYQGRPAMTMDKDSIAIHDNGREVLAATIAVVLKQGWQEVSIDSKDAAIRQALIELAHEAGLRVSGVPAPSLKESEGYTPAAPGMR